MVLSIVLKFHYCFLEKQYHLYTTFQNGVFDIAPNIVIMLCKSQCQQFPFKPVIVVDFWTVTFVQHAFHVINMFFISECLGFGLTSSL